MTDLPTVGIRVPATTANLGPGYDTFGAAVSLYLDARTVTPSEQAARVVSEGEGAGELPDDDENLLWRSFLALCAHAGVEAPDLRIRVRNSVPLERGLGSSSAAIVAGLGLARAVCDLAVSDLEIVRIAADIEGHPDNVAPAVLGGLVTCATTDAGALVVRRAQPHPRLRPVALVPSSRQATTAARDAVPTSVARDDVVTQAARAGHVLGALLGAWPVAPDLAGDRLHEPPRLDAMGPTGEVIRSLRERGVHAWLSGAGPTAAAAIALRDRVGHLDACGEVGAANGFAVHPLAWDLGGLRACP